MTLSDAALSFGFRGWPVFPCEPRGKRPLTTHGFKDATTDLEQVRAYWHRWPNANIATPTGRYVVVEIDGPEGAASMTALRVANPWPATLTSMSGRPGLHFFFTPPEGVRVGNAAGMRGSRGLGVGIDVRGEGGYVLVPPSVHPTGRRYTWVNRSAVAPLPAWMVERLKPPPPMAYEIPDDAGDAYGRAALIGECGEVESAAEGTLNDTLNRSAFKLGRLVRGGALRESEVREALLAAAMVNGHPERGAARTIESGLTAGMRR